MSESQNAEHVVGRARRAAEQFRGHCRVLGLISPLVKGTAEIEELDTLTKVTETGFNALVLLEGLAREDSLRKLESNLQTLEQKLQLVDAQIPMGWFREHFDASQASSVALADYAMMLGRHAGVDPSRLDRVQFLLTRMVSFFISPEDDSPALRRQLLAEALPPSTLAANTREAVVAFCHDATRRLGTFTHLKDLIDSGFFVDVRGYKLSLRQQLLDPDVMVAVIELNEATTDTLDRLAEAAQQQGVELQEHLDEVDQRIKSIFKQLRVDEAEKTEQFQEWIQGSAGARAKGKRPRARDFMSLKADRREDKRLVLGVITLVLGLVFLFRLPASQELRTLTAEECAALSPLLVSGAVAPEKAPRILVGAVDKSRWALMDSQGRRQAALQLAEKVAAKGWVAATVMLEEQVVLQIESGNVLVVQ